MRKRIIATSLNKKRFLSGVFLTLLATVVNAQPFPYQQAGLPVSVSRQRGADVLFPHQLSAAGAAGGMGLRRR